MSYFGSLTPGGSQDLVVTGNITSKTVRSQGSVDAISFDGYGFNAPNNMQMKARSGSWIFTKGVKYGDIFPYTDVTLNFGFTNINYNSILYLVANGAQLYSVQVSGVSDYRIKENFRTPKNNILERLCSINMFDYNLKKIPNVVYENKEPINHIGFFAHELQEMFPEYQEIVFHKKDEPHKNGIMITQQINSFTFSNILMKSIQEQNTEVKQMQLDLQEQNEKINQLFLTVQALQAEVQELKSK